MKVIDLLTVGDCEMSCLRYSIVLVVPK